MPTLITVSMTLAVLALSGWIFVFSILYDRWADAPHWSVTHRSMSAVRDPSIAQASHTRSRTIESRAPEWCRSVRRDVSGGQSPGVSNSQERAGLYPQPPDLSTVLIPPAQAFWAIKHGIKVSAMPAWEASHDDATIWSMVSFLQVLPTMSPEQYRNIVAEAPPDENMKMDMKLPSGHSSH